MTGNDETRIEQWGVIGDARLTGLVFNRPGHHDGRTIVTSPVAQIQIVGTGKWPGSFPMAITQSGSSYRLGRPALAFGIQSAKEFIYSKLTPRFEPTGSNPLRGALAEERTIIRAAVDTSLHHFEQIDIDHTTFDTGWLR